MSECVFRILIARLFRQNTLLLSGSASQGIYDLPSKGFTQMAILLVLISFQFIAIFATKSHG